MPGPTSSSICSPSIGLRRIMRSAHGDPVSAAPTFDNATVIRYDGTGTRVSVTRTADPRISKPLKRHTWSPPSQASQVTSRRSRARASSASCFDPSADPEVNTSPRGTHLSRSSDFKQASKNTLDSRDITASPLPLSPASSVISAPSPQISQASGLPSQPSPDPTFPPSRKDTVIEKKDGYWHFPDFDQMQADLDKISTGKTTEMHTEPPRSSCGQTSVGGTVPSKDGKTSSPGFDASTTQAQMSILNPPTRAPTTVQSKVPHSYMSFPRFPRSKARRPPLEQMTGSCISAC
jgi:hypothetical protein